MKNTEFDKFDTLMRELVRVPHAELKATLDAEKAAKVAQPKRGPRPKEHK
jgi:hypothetical protein